MAESVRGKKLRLNDRKEAAMKVNRWVFFSRPRSGTITRTAHLSHDAPSYISMGGGQGNRPDVIK